MTSLVVLTLAALAAEPESKPAPKEPAEPAAAEEERRKLEEEIARELGSPPPAPAAPAPGESAPAAAGSAPATGGSALGRILLLPDIAAIGRASLLWRSRNPADSPRPGPAVPAHEATPVFEELELSLQAVVDPYARADVFLTFGPAEVGVEEAYLTTLALPAGLQARAGTLKSPFGRLNQQHPHVWDFADAPLALSRLVARESLAGPGVDLAWLAPVPWFAELHLAFQVTGPALPEGLGRAEGRTWLARLVQFADLSEAATLGVGLSAARVAVGPGAWDGLGGADLYLKVRRPAGRAYVALQAELFARRLRGTGEDATSLGGYAQAVWRPSARWAFGLRWDCAPADVPGPEQRASALASMLPSEFLRLRLQGGVDRLPGGAVGFEAGLGLEFSIGAHGAHPF